MKPFLAALTLGLTVPFANSQSIPATAGEVLYSTKIQRGSTGDQFGRSVAVIGDLDGDGIDDLAVGANGSDDGAVNAGSVWILFMQADYTVKSSQKISATFGGFNGPLNFDNQFGKAVCGLGDLDGDGVLDIAVGAPSESDPRDRAVYTLFLNTNGTVKSWQRITNTATGYGRALTNMGDFDGDGVDDIMIGSGRGRVWLYYWNPDGTEKNSRTYFARNDSTSGLPNFYGVGVTNIGDWDGDGVSDALIGDSGNDLGGTDLGVMYISLANPIGFPKQEIPLYDGQPNFSLGLMDYPNFGRDGCLVGDLDGNGVEEIVIACSEWYGDGDPFDSGALFVAFMESDGSILDYRRISATSGNLGQTITSGVEFGICATALGDINGDGIQDIATGARFGGSGTLYILRMNDGTLEDVAAFGSASPLSGNAPLDVQFTDSSTGSVTAWLWEFGDGQSSTEQHPLHTYTQPGSYFVTLRVTGPGMLSDVRNFTVPINVGPNLNLSADFSSDAVMGALPLTVNFSDSSTGIVDDWFWDFGDGSTSTLQNPSHTYNSVGFFDVSLSISNSGESDSLTRTDYIEVLPPAPTAAFSADVTSGLSPLDVNFSDQSLGLPTSWLWDFGDGGSSTLQDPMHTFNTGSYTIALTATNSSGSDTLIQTDLIVVQPPAPVAAFSASVMQGGLPLVVQFTDLSTQAPTAWSWDFGDGGSSTLQHPQHTYTQAGSYQVSLLASNASGSDSFQLPGLILVVAAPPVASFGADPTGGILPLVVQFTDTSTDDPYSWDWDFGDGSQSTEQHPNHTYTTPGDFMVSLRVGNPLGSDTALAASPISVLPPVPIANFSADVTSGIVPVSVNFTDLSQNFPSSWAWDFGDGFSSTEQSPSHTYTTVGSYSVTLDVTNASGSSQYQLPTLIAVLPVQPDADFSADVTAGITPLAVQFTDLTTLAPSVWLWKFGDGTTSSLQNPAHVYTDPGVYHVVLKVIAPSGKDIERKFNYIQAGLKTGIGAGQFEAQVPPDSVPLPWTPSSPGTQVTLQAGKAAQPGMPSQGRQWLQLSAEGSLDARPPSRPGGATQPGHGASVVSQSFLMPRGRYELCFDAAFQLNGEFADAAFNDWMSVDITHAERTHNLYYRDSFSHFDSPRFGLRMPSTGVESVRVNLAQLFPELRAGSPVTLRIQVGNGGDGQLASLGHVDDVRLEVAGHLQVYGGPNNPEGSLRVEGRPRLGETLRLHLDNPLGSQCGGSTRVELFFSTRGQPNFPAGTSLAGYGMGQLPGEALIEWKLPAHRFLRLALGAWAGVGSPLTASLGIPDDARLVGLELFAQGLFLDATADCGTRFGLTQAARIVVGP